MTRQRSRKILIGVGLFGLLLLALPFLIMAWTDRSELSGKALVFEGQSRAADSAMLQCLLTHRSDGLALQISSEDHFYDAAAGIAVRIENRGTTRTLRAWSTEGHPLSPAQHARLESCLQPPER